MEKLILDKVSGYEVRGNSSDRGPSYRVGLFKHRARAVDASKGKGFWSDGDVNSITLYTDGVSLYEVIKVGSFIDEKEDHDAWMTEQIKGKLTEEEQDFLKLK
jgi:hypothetical protein